MKSIIFTIICLFILSGFTFGEEVKKAETPKKAEVTVTNPKVVVPVKQEPTVKVGDVKITVKKEEVKKVAVSASQPSLDGGVSGSQIISDVKDVAVKAKEVKSATDKSVKLLAIFALLAVIFKLLISFLKYMSKWFITDSGKAVIRLSTLILGFLTYLVSNLALGMSWTDSLWLSISGPGSLMIHEFSMLIPYFKKLREAKTQDVAVSNVPPIPPVGA